MYYIWEDWLQYMEQNIEENIVYQFLYNYGFIEGWYNKDKSICIIVDIFFLFKFIFQLILYIILVFYN